MKFEKFFHQNEQRKKLYKIWQEGKFSEYYGFLVHHPFNYHAISIPKVDVFQSCRYISSLVEATELKFSEIKDLH